MIRRLIFLLLLMFVPTTAVLAQIESTESATPSSNLAPIDTQAKEERFNKLRQDYLFQLEKYKEAENRFQLDKAEFNKLQTLASREKAVLSMKPFLISRAQVWFTYLVALEFLLQDSQGIDVTDRRFTLEQVNQSKQMLLDYQKGVDVLEDRDSVNQSSAFFESTIRAQLLESQFRVLTLLATGRVQRAFDQYNLAVNDFNNSYIAAIDDVSLKARIERGMQDVLIPRDQAKSSLDKVVAFYPDPFSQVSAKDPKAKKPNYQTIYNASVKELQTSFAAMKRSIRFLKELEMQI